VWSFEKTNLQNAVLKWWLGNEKKAFPHTSRLAKANRLVGFVSGILVGYKKKWLGGDYAY
jgi:hypothetical protein